MHVVEKTFQGRRYYYWVEKARRGKRVVTSRTVYIGNWQKLGELLQAQTSSVLPESFSSQEAGGSLAFVKTAQELGIEAIIDEACPVRSGAAPIGRSLLLVVLHRVLASRAENGLLNLQKAFKACALSELLPIAESSLNDRRLGEMLARITPKQVDAIERAVVERVIEREGIDLQALAFDCTNLDSYVSAANPSRLLKRGHGKSGKQLRTLGLGLLVAEDGGIPLLSFSYPGNENDVTAFRRFLKALGRRRAGLSLPLDATVAADGGNISKPILRKLERPSGRGVGYVLRLPVRHAGALERVASEALPELAGLKGVRAQKYTCAVYSQDRCVVDVHSARMHGRQLPGLLRDRKKARADLVHLQRQLELQREGLRRAKPLTVAALKRRSKKALTREHMGKLFAVQIAQADGAPRLSFQESEVEWQHLQTHVLGRTLLVTSRADWTAERLVRASRVQGSNERFFRDIKDHTGASMLPLRHRNDPPLRANALVAVLGLLLAKVILRRLKKAGVAVRSVGKMLRTLKAIQRARMKLPAKAPPALRGLAATTWVPSERSELQEKMLCALGLQGALRIGPTLGKPRNRSGSVRSRKK